MKERRYFVKTLFGAALAAPILLLADDHDHDKDHDRDRVERYYDRDAKAWHEWNEAEQGAYHRWWDEHFHDRKFREFRRLNERDQREYWKWRREHHDDDRH